MSDAVLVAIVVAIPTTIATAVPLLTARQNFRRQDKVAAQAQVAAALLEERQNAAAARAAETADRLLASQQETKAAAEEVARVAAESQTATDAKLNEISNATDRVHDLVNSDMTAARREALEQTRLTLTAVEKLVSMARDAGRAPEPVDLRAIEDAKTRIDELEAILADRLNQLRIVEAKAKAKDRPL